MDFFKLSKIRRPSSTPVTIEAKLSSSRIMSAACFDTSEPEIPIATPMSAFFKAGESFTPSPGVPSEMIPTDLAMALAVIGWSPVTMITLIPADRHLATASGTAARGGSIMDMSPTKRRFSVGKLGSSELNLKPTGYLSDGRT
ncbi:Protein of unknown function [Cotesia congregata]|uniref:Uncharacterized protein n=1 Tax=Cotesia congregata TaxID=51543 RepID=A0A8J2HSA5_COTCN|nr:Protein of unknown function [Cotesia congregata]